MFNKVILVQLYTYIQMESNSFESALSNPKKWPVCVYIQLTSSELLTPLSTTPE